MIDRTAFFNSIRANLFDGRLTQAQVNGTNAILDEWENRFLNGDLRWLAYMLATVKLETAHTMQPINEMGGDAYFFRMYDKNGERPSVARALGNTQVGDGVRFHGRGYVQLTGRNNYTRMAALTGADLVGHPDLALDPRIAADIMFEGMQRGDFTGKKLADYFTADKSDWVEARRIINGLDRAHEIAAFAQTFDSALRGAATTPIVVEPTPATVEWAKQEAEKVQKAPPPKTRPLRDFLNELRNRIGWH